MILLSFVRLASSADGGADLPILCGVFQIIHDLLQVFFRLVNPLHVAEANAVRGLDLDLGIRFAKIEHHGSSTATGLVHQLLRHELTEQDKNADRQQP